MDGVSGRVVCVNGWCEWRGGVCKGGLCGRVVCVEGWCVSKGGVCVGWCVCEGWCMVCV